MKLGRNVKKVTTEAPSNAEANWDSTPNICVIHPLYKAHELDHHNGGVGYGGGGSAVTKIDPA